MTSPFKVTCDELAVKFSFGDGSIAIRMDLTPQAARNLAQDLIDQAQLCEDANDHEREIRIENDPPKAFDEDLIMFKRHWKD
jgi:hypothetical protein